MKTVNTQGHATEIFSDWAIQYISDKKNSPNPFFLYLAYNAPHTPVQPPKEWLNKIRKREEGMSEKRANLVALIEHMDHNIGRVYEALDKTGQLENTLIVFASDNGGQENAGANNMPYRGAKEDMYEGGIRVPAGAYWKGHIAPQVNDNFVMHMDVFPTICDLLTIPIQHKIDGVSILPLFRGEKQETDNRMVYWVRREGNMRYGGKAYYASRFKNYKLLQNTPWEPLQFFNIQSDVQEQNPIPDKQSSDFINLFNGMMEHIRLSGAIPWQAPVNDRCDLE